MPIRVIELSGSPREMGRQHGEALREEARAMIETRLVLAEQAAARLSPPRDRHWALALAAEAVPALQAYSSSVFEELSGIAEATGLSLPELVIGNGWTDFHDLLRLRQATYNCTSLVVAGTLMANGHLHLGQTWDMNVSAAPYIVAVRRRPKEGPSTLWLTTAGCLSLIGLNEEGIAVGNTNLTPTDAQPGVFYLALIHSALQQRTLADAAAAITQAYRMSGHYYWLGDSQDRFLGVETTGTQYATITLPEDRYVHTNHYLHEQLQQSGLTTPPGENSLARQQRAEHLLASLSSGSSVTELSQILSDHTGSYPICRHIVPGAEWATLAAAIVCPATREMWIWAGTPCQNDVTHFSI